MNPNDILISYSLGLYSNWFYHKPSRCLFDAGEGVATTLGKKVFAIQNIFLTHGHEDHIAGISNLVNIRNITSGEFDKPLAIYYPKHDRLINALIEYIEKKQSGLLRFPLYVHALEPGDEVEIGNAKRPTKVVAFEMQHAIGQLCLGYEIDQEKKVLDVISGKSMYKSWPIFFYSGDGFIANREPYERIDIAIHDATFLAKDVGEAASRIAHRHCTVEKAIEWAAGEDVKNLILCHISDRYSLEEIIPAAYAAKEKYNFRGELFAAYRSLIVKVLPSPGKL